jgi:glycine/D-amino acid oxidase-like deaminating enzyme
VKFPTLCISRSASQVHGDGGRPRVVGVRTGCGQTVECDAVVNCGGAWSRKLGAQAGARDTNSASFLNTKHSTPY